MAEGKTFRLVIASVDETLLDAQAVSITAPGSDGEFTMLAAHEPMVTTLKQGTITARLPNESPKKFDVKNGVLECSGNSVTVLL